MQPEYKDWCLKYFEAQYRYRIRLVLTRENVTAPYCLPNEPFSKQDDLNDGILPYLLKDTAFYHSLIPRFTAEESEIIQPGPDLIWEAFGVNVEEYVELQKGWGILAPSDRTSNVLEGILTYGHLRNQRGIRSIRSNKPSPESLELVVNEIKTLEEEDDHCQAMAVRFINLRIKQLHQNFLTRLEYSPTLAEAMGDKRDWPLPLPMYYGLQLYLSKMWEPLVEQCLEKSLDSLPPPTTPAPTISALGYPRANDIILFSTAGTGKTRLILDLLDNTWGIYAVAPGVRSTSGDSSILEPSRGGASSDTLSIFEDLKSLNRTDFLVHGTNMNRLVECLVFTRQCLFDTFLKSRVYSINMGFNCREWIKIQISCSKTCDPFDAGWRLARLWEDTYPGGRSEATWRNVRAWCIDEAQSAFDDPLAEEILRNLWSQGVASLSEVPRVLSGTSLRLTEARSFAMNMLGDKKHIPIEVTDLDIVASKDQFWRLFRSHLLGIFGELDAVADTKNHLLTRAGRSLDFEVSLSLDLKVQLEKLNDLNRLDASLKDLHDFIATECSQFFGRYRFSTLFIEHILKEAAGSGLNKGAISRAVQSASDAARNALWKQLDKIQGTSWVEDLYWMAIRTDIFSQSSIITDEHARLVSEGFALVKNMRVVKETRSKKRRRSSDSEPMEIDSPKPSDSVRHEMNERHFVDVALCEPLAINAVMTYLRKSDRYENLMNRFFSLLQIDNADQGTIGKVAEYVLACKLDNFLSDDPFLTRRIQKSEDTISIHRRAEFYGILSSACRIDYKGGCWEVDQMAYDGFFLCGHHVDPAQSQSLGMSIEGWLKTVASGNHSRFLFPAKEEGPDLLFVLRKDDERILCVLQFKTGEAEYQGGKVEKAVGSLTKGLKKGIFNSFNHPIIYINVVTSASAAIDQSTFLSKVESLLGQDHIPRAQRDYFCYMEGRNSVSVWGETFHELIRLMKGLE